MTIVEVFAGAVGATPLIRLERLSAETGCDILGKAEFMNPGGSVKDRAARAIVEAAERDGSLRPGGSSRRGSTPVTWLALTARSSPTTPAVFLAATLVSSATSSRTVVMSSMRASRLLPAMSGSWRGRAAPNITDPSLGGQPEIVPSADSLTHKG